MIDAKNIGCRGFMNDSKQKLVRSLEQYRMAFSTGKDTAEQEQHVRLALPDQRNAETIIKAINEICSGMLDIKPRDPIEGIPIAN